MLAVLLGRGHVSSVRRSPGLQGSSAGPLHALAGGVIRPHRSLWEGFAAFTPLSPARLPPSLCPRRGERLRSPFIPRLQISGRAGQLAGTGPAPACQLRPAVRVTRHPSAALRFSCRLSLSPRLAGKGPGAGGREGGREPQ